MSCESEILHAFVGATCLVHACVVHAFVGTARVVHACAVHAHVVHACVVHAFVRVLRVWCMHVCCCTLLATLTYACLLQSLWICGQEAGQCYRPRMPPVRRA